MKKVVLLLAALSLAGCNSQPAQTAKTAQPTTTDTAPTVVPAAKPIPVIWKSLSLYGADTGMTIAQFKATLGSRQFTRAECSDANATGHITCAIKDGYMESEFAFSNGTLYSVSFFVVGDASVTDAGRKLKQTYGPWTCLTENERHAWWIHPDHAIVQAVFGRAIMEDNGGQGVDSINVNIWDPRYAPAHLPRPTKAETCK